MRSIPDPLRATVGAAAAAVGGALLGLHGGPVGTALAGAVAVLLATLARPLRPALAALPAALGALQPAPVPLPSPWAAGAAAAFGTADPTAAGWSSRPGDLAVPDAAVVDAGERRQARREGPVRVDGHVVGRARRGFDPGTWRVELRVAGAPHRAATLPLTIEMPNSAVAVGAPLLPGDRVRGLCWLRLADDPDARPAATTRLGALSIEPGPPSPRRLSALLAARLGDALAAAVGPTATPLMTHLVLGDGPRVDDALVRAHRATGLAHLLAVSGAHLSLLAWMLAGPLGAGGRDPWRRRAVRRLAFALLFVYATVTGGEPPVMRAMIAWTVLVWTESRGRRASVASALAAAALVTAALWPDELLTPSFVLSYAAVVGLAAAGALRADGFAWSRALLASAWAALTTAPFTLGWFGQIAPWTLVGTPLLAPLVAGMLGLGLVAAGIGTVAPAVAAVPGAVAAWCASVYATAVEALAGLPLAPIHAPFLPPVTAVIAGGLGAALMVWRRPDRIGLALACCLACIPHFVPLHAPRTPGLHLLRVGHGQACLVVGEDGATTLIDCGDRRGGARAARRVFGALPPGRRRIDRLIVTHADADHAGGVAALLDRLPVARATLGVGDSGSAPARALGRYRVPIDWLGPGERQTLGTHVVASPDLPASAARNDRSLWVRLSVAGHTVLLPGDAEAAGLDALVRSGWSAPADVLLLPHHGRGDPAWTMPLLERVAPRLALVSTGDRAPPLVAAARAFGVPVASTATAGDLLLRVDGLHRERPEPVARGREPVGLGGRRG